MTGVLYEEFFDLSEWNSDEYFMSRFQLISASHLEKKMIKTSAVIQCLSGWQFQNNRFYFSNAVKTTAKQSKLLQYFNKKTGLRRTPFYCTAAVQAP